MMTTADQNVEEICQAAIKEDPTKIKRYIYFMKHDLLFIGVNSQFFSVGMELVIRNQISACAFLINEGVDIEEFACGAAYIGNKSLLMDYLEQAKNKQEEIDTQRVASFAARGGHISLAIELIKSILPEKQDFNDAACWAAYSGYQEHAETLLEQLPLNERNFIDVACYAVLNNKLELALTFLTKVPPDVKIDYNRLASFAAQAGSRENVNYFLEKLPFHERNHMSIATEAVHKGHAELAREFYDKTPADKQNLELMQLTARFGWHPPLENEYQPPVATCHPKHPPLFAPVWNSRKELPARTAREKAKELITQCLDCGRRKHQTRDISS